MTTDGDLALDTDLLADDPELAQTLHDAGFTPDKQPGSWVGAGGVKVDLMVTPHQSGRAGATARSASLPPHDKRVARIARGLEPALVDNSMTRISSLDPDQNRSVQVRVAGPAALLVAKLTKIKERQDEVAAGKAAQRRIKNKDALDIYRILLKIPTEHLADGLQVHRKDEHACAVLSAALDYLRGQHDRGREGHLVVLVAQELPEDPVAPEQLEALVDDLLTTLDTPAITDHVDNA